MSHEDILALIFIVIGLVLPGMVMLLDDSKSHGK